MPHLSMISVLAELHQRELVQEAERYRRARAARAEQTTGRGRGPRWSPGAWLRRAPNPEAAGCLAAR